MRTVSNYEELLEYAYDCLDKSKIVDTLELEGDFDYTITVKGELWDHYIDWRLAKLVVEIQNSVNKMLKDASLSLTEEEKIKTVVKFRVSKGSSLVEVKFDELLQLVVNQMTGGQIAAVLIVGILVTGGYLTVKRIAARKEAEDSEVTKRELAKVIEKVAVYEKPLRGLVSRLGKDDKIAISPLQKELSKKEIRKEYPGKSKYKSENVYLDGVYTIVAVKLDTGKITVEQGEHRFDCQSSLSPEENRKLFSNVEEAYSEGRVFDLPLKITAEYFKGSKKIKKQNIYEIGEPRKGVKGLDDLFEVA